MSKPSRGGGEGKDGPTACLQECSLSAGSRGGGGGGPSLSLALYENTGMLSET